MTFDHKWVVPARSPRSTPKTGMTQTVPNLVGYWGLTTTTAADQLKLLAQIMFPCALIDPQSRPYEVGLMTHIDPCQDWQVSACPLHATNIALKHVWLRLDAAGWQINSVGYVDGSGREYLIAVLHPGSQRGVWNPEDRGAVRARAEPDREPSYRLASQPRPTLTGNPTVRR